MAGPPPYIPPPPPPPPSAPYGFYEGAPSARPTSGKAIASLICGLLSLTGAFCILPAVGGLVGVVLGILGIVESGREGKRSGRGLAIAGVITSVLGIGGTAAMYATFFVLGQRSEEQFERSITAELERDQELLLKRLKQYYESNGNSLGPGGPVLAGDRGFAPTPGEGNAPPQDTRPRVSGMLEIKHLADEHELGADYGGANGWKLIINGRSSATLRYSDWSGKALREVEIRDIGKGDWFVTLQ